MNEILIRISLSDGACLPEYKTEGSSGADIRACIENPLTIPAGGRASVPTGLRMEIPIGFEGQVRPRSGLALAHGITCLNSPGTIDSDYRGELKVILINHGLEPFTIRPGERIAQLVLAPISRGTFAISDTLSDTSRGDGGFGSTGL